MCTNSVKLILRSTEANAWHLSGRDYSKLCLLTSPWWSIWLIQSLKPFRINLSKKKAGAGGPGWQRELFIQPDTAPPEKEVLALELGLIRFFGQLHQGSEE